MEKKAINKLKSHCVSLASITDTCSLAEPTKEQTAAGCLFFALLWLSNNNPSKSLSVRNECFTHNSVLKTLKDMSLLRSETHSNPQTNFELTEERFQELFAPFVAVTISIPGKPDYFTDNLLEKLLAKYITRHNFFYQEAIQTMFEWRLKLSLKMVTSEDMVSMGIY